MADDLDRHYDGAGQYWNVDPNLLRAVHAVENPKNDPDAVSPSGAIGHMQFMPKTARALNIDPHNPVHSIYGAARLLRENLDRYGNVVDALRAYNDGTDRSKWGNEETMAYPQKVAQNYAAIKGQPQDDPFAGAGMADPQPASKPNGNAFDTMFGKSDEVPKPKAGADPFASVFGKEDASSLPAKAQAHQGTFLGNMVSFGSDAIDSAAAEVIKAGANIIDGVTFHKLHGTQYDPRLFKRAAEQEIADHDDDWGSTASKYGGALVGDAVVGGTLGRFLPGGGNALVRGVTRAAEGAATARLMDQNPLLGALGGAASVPLGAVASKIISKVMARGGAEAAPEAQTASAPLPPSDAPPEAVKLGLLTGPKQADKLAQRIWADYQKGGPAQVIESQIPGVHLTASQATGNAGLAQLERVRRAANPSPFVALEQANTNARNDYLRQIVGTEDQLQAAEAARSAAEASHREAAFGKQSPVDVTPIRNHLADLIAQNRGRDTVQQPLRNVMGQLAAVTEEDGTAMPEHLWNVRKYLGDMVSPRARGTANDGQAAASQLLDLKPTITDVIENGAPGFKKYASAYEELSRPIDAMRFLQSRNLTDAQGNVRLGQLDTMLKAIRREKGKPGVRDADSVNEEQIEALEKLRDDMRLASRIDLGKARGSDTNVNLTTSGRVARMAQGVAPKLAAGAAGMVEGGALGGLLANGAAKVVENRMLGRMANTQAATYDAIDNMLINPRR
ncbi:lytic transglycosylase domain-containing protein [Kozakia baliensis]|uniref:lytic transglycosylase domain-containing protein n=1 Tax=Kozakia baliensis TaxID=153496 RepID=UPI00068A9F5A|nr:lytic transglycosylase domain-containing protein [Kozakia baliensis]